MKARNLATIATAAVGALVLTTSPAAALAYVTPGQGLSPCPSGSVCAYLNYDLNESGSNDILVTDQSLPDLHPYGFGDVASSYYNHTSHYVTFYDHGDYQGAEKTVAPGAHANFTGNWNDDLSSLKILP
ncbi:peptidase inhibitor family I36 protein [Streptomyces sp. HSW2009]|uniref:peptidase inhibitor family I36 protein n=1 Tax=Streptomyces sp. HSW2009 TaxID=3142890 RepID=UPI0032EB9D75